MICGKNIPFGQKSLLLYEKRAECLGGIAIMDDEINTSRPKVHRLPSQQAQEDERVVSRTVLFVCLGLLLIAIIPALQSFNKVDKNKIAQSLTPGQATMIAPTAPVKNDVIAVQDDRGEMVGQLARMPADMEKGTSIKSMSKVDPKSGKELMNIIGKH